MLESRTVTAQDAAQYREDDERPARAVIEDGHATPPGEPLRVLGEDGEWTPGVRDGWWVVRHGPGDYCVMTDREYQRYYGGS